LAYVIQEAHQAELPIVASRVGGIPEILDGYERGTLVTAGNERETATAIEKVILTQTVPPVYSNPRIEFSLETMVSKTMEIYN